MTALIDPKKYTGKEDMELKVILKLWTFDWFWFNFTLTLAIFSFCSVFISY